MIGTVLDPHAPDGDEARRLAEEELRNPRYAEAKPTWFDYLAQNVADFINSLFSPEQGVRAGSTALIVIAVVIAAALVVVLILWGRPRRSQRVRRGSRDLLGERDDRSAAQLRADAERSARGQDWDAAVALRFRAIARALLERDIIDPAPGATAQAIARDAAEHFPAQRPELLVAARSFDEVRYLRHPGSEEMYRAIADADARIAALPAPALAEARA